MRDFKVKLISFPSNYYRNMYVSSKLFFFPYGLGVLSSFLKGNNYDNVNLDDLSIKIENHNRKFGLSQNSKINLDTLRYEKEIADYVLSRSCNKKIERFAEQIVQIADCQSYDLIGISVMVYSHFLHALLLAKMLKSMGNTKIVLGGPFITIHGKNLFEQFPVIDYIIIGDGQVPLLRLIEYLEGRTPIEDIPSLLYRDNGSIRMNPRKPFPIEDVCPPDFSDLPLDFYRPKINSYEMAPSSLPYQITRGCVRNCSFCSLKIINPFVESKSYNKVITEIRAMKERYQNNVFWFCDETINSSYEYLDKLCDIFIKENLDIFWTTSARADNLDRNILHKMRKAGCRHLMFGIESGSNRILKAMGKGFTVEHASKVLRDSHEEGIGNGLFLIVGFPHEKEEDIAATVEFIRKNSEYIDTIGVITPLRVEYGSPLYNNPEKFGIENLRPVLNDFGGPEFKYFAFDEIGGLKWQEKAKQQKHHRKKVVKANFRYILPKKYHLGFIPFWAYFWIQEKLRNLYNWLFLPVFQRFLFCYLEKKRKINNK